MCSLSHPEITDRKTTIRFSLKVISILPLAPGTRVRSSSDQRRSDLAVSRDDSVNSRFTSVPQSRFGATVQTTTIHASDSGSVTG